MRVVNRIAVTLVAAEPYLEWSRGRDSDASKGMLTVARAKPYGSAFLLPEFELEEDVREWIEENRCGSLNFSSRRGPKTKRVGRLAT